MAEAQEFAQFGGSLDRLARRVDGLTEKVGGQGEALAKIVGSLDRIELHLQTLSQRVDATEVKQATQDQRLSQHDVDQAVARKAASDFEHGLVRIDSLESARDRRIGAQAALYAVSSFLGATLAIVGNVMFK